MQQRRPDTHLLIPYIQLPHPDPALNEFTYGDGGARARKLKSALNKGDYVFFHTSRGGKKYITAYYVVDRALDTMIASQDKAIKAKYKNPHILECLAGKRPLQNVDDVVLFGDPIKSRVLDRPLPFDKTLAGKLSLKIKFPPNQSVTQVIGSATFTQIRRSGGNHRERCGRLYRSESRHNWKGADVRILTYGWEMKIRPW